MTYSILLNISFCIPFKVTALAFFKPPTEAMSFCIEHSVFSERLPWLSPKTKLN